MKHGDEMSSIPLYFIEEHHEAFLIWHEAIKKKCLPPKNNTLLHIDHHSDMMNPILRTSIQKLALDTPELRRFTYEELKIGDFIYPAIYQGVFNTIIWLLQPDEVASPTPAKKYVLSTYLNEGKVFLINQVEPSASGSVSFIRHDITIEDTINPPHQALVLDIDLDYFSTVEYQNRLIRLEITQEQYEKFRNNKYHPLRFEYHCFSEQIGDQYFMIFNQSEDIVIRNRGRVSNDEILERIDKICKWLSKNQINPAITVICRDNYSGYLPADQGEFIEQHLLNALESLYEFQVISLD